MSGAQKNAFGFALAALIVLVFFVDGGSLDLRSSACIFEHPRRYASEIGIVVVCVVLPILVSHVLRPKSATGGDDTSTVPVDVAKGVEQQQSVHGENRMAASWLQLSS